MNNNAAAHLQEAADAMALVDHWDALTPAEKTAERAKGAASKFRDVPATDGLDGFEVRS